MSGPTFDERLTRAEEQMIRLQELVKEIRGLLDKLSPEDLDAVRERIRQRLPE